MSDLEAYFWWVIIPTSVVSPLLLFALLGICFAPFAAVANAVVARRQRRHVFRNFVGGFGASMLLFLPWACLLSKQLGWRHTTGLLQVTFVLLFVGWGVSIAVLALVELVWVIAFLVGLTNTDGIFAEAFAPYSPLLIVAAAVVALSIWIWQRERKSVFEDLPNHAGHWSSESAFLPLRLIEPCFFASVWALATPLVLVGVGYAALHLTFGSS